LIYSAFTSTKSTPFFLPLVILTLNHIIMFSFPPHGKCLLAYQDRRLRL
jgi:hypothetical protein